jgi:tetratricopeptide (TPR) repeat protein
MKKIMVKTILSVSLLTVYANANVINTAKEYGNKAMFWKSEHLDSIDYETVYPKKFYEKSYFGVAVTGAAIVGAGAFTYFTAGTGAPAAATGVSTVASWAAGGGAGSYMAGLSTIGGYFGGNAILGASILNGIALGTIGGGVGTTTLSVAAKISTLAMISASSLDGVFYYMNPETKQLEYKIKVSIPKNIGSKKTRKLVDEIYDINKKFNEAVEKKEAIYQKHLTVLKEENNRYALELMEYYIKQDQYNQEDLLVLGIVAWNNGKYDLFRKAISKIDKSKLKNTSFYNYLMALSDFSEGKVSDAKLKLQNSIDENNYAIEPVILYINILANEDFNKNEDQILKYVEKIANDFNSDDYATEYSLVSIYYRLGTMYFYNKRYSKAKEYYEKANDELNLFQTYFSNSLKHIVQLGIANSLYSDSKIEDAEKRYNEIIDNIDNEEEKARIKGQYLGRGK